MVDGARTRWNEIHVSDGVRGVDLGLRIDDVISLTEARFVVLAP